MDSTNIFSVFFFFSWIPNNPLVCTKELKWIQTWMTAHPTVVKDLTEQSHMSNTLREPQ